MKIRPRDPGVLIRDPHTRRLLPDEGYDVPDGDVFWQRRLDAGEVVLVEREGSLVMPPVAPLSTRGVK